MTEIGHDILENLKCDYCTEYLSCAPVLLKKTGKSVCGRCIISEKDKDTSIRNEAYEKLASVILFPCRYHVNGCEEKLQMAEVIIHEKSCRYILHNCPTSAVDNNCKWTGQLTDIEHHYKQHHSELVVGHPYRVKPIIKRDNMNNYVFKMSGFLFLLQIQVETLNGQFWHCVRLLDHPKLCSLFQYTIKIANDFANFNNISIVEPYNNFNIIEEDCIKHKIKNVLSEIGNFDDVYYELRVSMSNVSCNVCKIIMTSASVYPNASGFCCQKCNDFLQTSLKIKRQRNKNENKNITKKKIESTKDNFDKIQVKTDVIIEQKQEEMVNKNSETQTTFKTDIMEQKTDLSLKEYEKDEKIDNKINDIKEDVLLIKTEEILNTEVAKNTVEKYKNIFEKNIKDNEYKEISEKRNRSEVTQIKNQKVVDEENIFAGVKSNNFFDNISNNFHQNQNDILEAQQDDNTAKLSITNNLVGKWWYGKFRAFNILFNLDSLLVKEKVCLDISTNRYNEKKCFDNTTYSCKYKISLPNAENVYVGEFSGHFKNWHFEKNIPEEYLNLHGCPTVCVINVEVIKE